MIKLFRIDDRLLHGQVAFAWAKHYGFNIIVIANDSVASDSTQQMTLKLAKPKEAKLYMKNISETIEILPRLEEPKFKALIIVNSTNDALELIKGYKGFKSLNVGGIRMAEGKKLVTRAVAVSQEDIENLKAVENKGIEVEVRQVPNESKKQFKTLI